MEFKIKNITNIPKLLFNNVSIKQTILKNTVWTYFDKIATNALSFILLAYVARILGANEYGKFCFALAFVSIFGIIADLGVSTTMIREFAGDRKREEEFKSLLSLKIILGLVMFIFVFISSFFVANDASIRKMILILALYIVINSGLLGMYFSFFQARQKMEYQAMVEILQAVLTTAICFMVLFNFPSAENLSYAYLIANVVVLIFVLIFFHFKISPLKISWDKEIYKKFLLMSWPLAFVAVLISIFNNVDSVMLGYWGQITQIGWYNAAYRITIALYVFSGIIAACTFPTMSESAKESYEKAQKIWNFQLESMIIIAFPLVIGGMVLAPRIINFL
jgi:O-antigen/teichoic acid export membrane protein